MVNREMEDWCVGGELEHRDRKIRDKLGMKIPESDLFLDFIGFIGTISILSCGVSFEKDKNLRSSWGKTLSFFQYSPR